MQVEPHHENIRPCLETTSATRWRCFRMQEGQRLSSHGQQPNLMEVFESEQQGMSRCTADGAAMH